MPYKDKETRNRKARERYHINKNKPDSCINSQKRKDYNKHWRENNRGWHKTFDAKLSRKIKQMIAKNKELENRPDIYEYDHTEEQKNKMRHHWCRNIDKVFKLRECDFEKAWSRYIKAENCELCNISLKKVRKNMEHNHKTGYFRYVACQRCNGYLRYVDHNFEETMKEILQR